MSFRGIAGGALYTMKSDGKKQKAIPTNPQFDSRPDWSVAPE